MPALLLVSLHIVYWAFYGLYGSFTLRESNSVHPLGSKLALMLKSSFPSLKGDGLISSAHFWIQPIEFSSQTSGNTFFLKHLFSNLSHTSFSIFCSGCNSDTKNPFITGALLWLPLDDFCELTHTDFHVFPV